MAVVEVVNNGYSKDRLLMHMIRCLFFVSEFFKIQVEVVHCPGRDNICTDVLSWNDIHSTFFTGISRNRQKGSRHSPLTTDLASGPAARLNVARLDKVVHSLYQAGLAQSTQKT